MSLPCSDQGLRMKKMKYASLSEGMEAARCWCGDIAKVRAHDVYTIVKIKYEMNFIPQIEGLELHFE
jgi:hypothetical protein